PYLESAFQPESGRARRQARHSARGNCGDSAGECFRAIRSPAGQKKAAPYQDQEIQLVNRAKPQPAWMKRGPQPGQESRSTFAGLEREYCSLSVVLFSRVASRDPSASHLGGFLPKYLAVSVDLNHWSVS